MNETLQAIADIYRADDPEDADFYTLDWVASLCAQAGISPTAMLEKLQSIAAEAEAADDGDQPGSPPPVGDPSFAEKFGGAVDGVSHKLLSNPTK